MRHLIPFTAIMALLGTALLADHPGERLDEVTAQKEPGFEAISGRASGLAFIGTNGQPFDLAEFAGRIVVVNVRASACLDPCQAQHDLLAQTVASLNASPMREMVRFVTIAEEPTGIDTIDAGNWSVAAPDDSLADVAAQLTSRSARQEDTPMIHLLDREGRHVAIFHGSDFAPLNLLMHINGLTNAHPHPEPESFLERAIGWFE